MAKVLVSDTYLAAIADAIRAQNASSETYKVDEMADTIRNFTFKDNNPDSSGGGNSIGNVSFANGTQWTASNITTGVDKIWEFDNLFLATGNGTYTSLDGKTWTKDSNVKLNYVEYHKGMYLATAADRQGFYRSFDGKNWIACGPTCTATQTMATEVLYIGYGNGMWIAAICYEDFADFMNSEMVVKTQYSMDGINWYNTNLTAQLSGLYYAEGIWVAPTEYEGIYYSLDGKNWTHSNLTSDGFTIIHNADGVWVTGSYYSDSGLYYSYDGKTWAQTNITTQNLSRLNYVNNLWFASVYEYNGSDYVDQTYFSEDGVTWELINLNGAWIDKAYCNGRVWLAISEDALLYSNSGKLWQTVSESISWSSINCIYYANGLWIVGVWDGYWYSTNGIDWYTTDSTTGLRQIYYSNGVWIALSSGALFYSVAWE